MKTIKTKILSFLSFVKKVRALPKKYLIIGGVVVIAVLGGVGTLIWQLAGDGGPESDTSNQKTNQKSESQDGTGDTVTADGQSTTNPDEPVASDEGAAGGSSNGSSSSKAKKSGGGPSVPAPAPQSDTSKPTTPGGFTVSNGPGVSRIMDWDASSDNVGVAGYYIYRMMFSNETPTRLIATITDGSTDDTEGDDVTVLCNSGYTTSYYAVRAFDAAGNLSNWATASILDEEGVNCQPIGT